MESRILPGFFLGWKLAFGASNRGALLIFEYDIGRHRGFKGTCIRTIPAKEFNFPAELTSRFAEARKLAIGQMQPSEPPWKTNLCLLCIV